MELYVARLLKENETLKRHYIDLRDSIKETGTKTSEQTTSLMVKNNKFKSQIQEKGFTTAALKNEVGKLTRNSVNTKFAKPSILGKPVLQSSRNHSVVRQPNAIRSEHPKFSKTQFASQVDAKQVLSKPVTSHNLPKKNASGSVKAQQAATPSPDSSRICSKTVSISSVKTQNSYDINDLYKNNDLEKARKRALLQKDGILGSRPHRMPSSLFQNSASSSKPKPVSTQQTNRKCPVSKSSCTSIKAIPVANHSKNPRVCSESKHLVCSTCLICVFKANHLSCATQFLKKVNICDKVQPSKTRNYNKPVEPKSYNQKPGRQINLGQRSSLNNNSILHEKPNIPRTCLRWIQTGRIFKIIGLRWIPIRKMFTDCKTKVESGTPNGIDADFTNLYKCKQTLNVSAGSLY